MYSIIGSVDSGEFAGSALALDYAVEPHDFVTFACWTPHRYVLSIEQNTVRRDVAAEIRSQLIDPILLRDRDGLGERFFDHDYLRVVRGPHEGRVVDVPARQDGLSAGEIHVVHLTARVPLIEAMSGSACVSIDLLDLLHDVAREGSGRRDVERLLAHCVKTVDWRADDHSPDMALRMWFAGLRQSYRDAPRDLRPARLRDAARMAQVITAGERFWVSGDWGPGLTKIMGLAIASLRSEGQGGA